jgi:hypothetical protein
MSDSAQPAPPPRRRRWPYFVIGMLTSVLVSGWLLGWFGGSRQPVAPGSDSTAPQPAASPASAPEAVAVSLPVVDDPEFLAQLEERKPVFGSTPRPCFVCGTEFKVRAGDARRSNSLGGVATDVMSLALSPPLEEGGPPNINRQSFDALLSTCPTCGATYFEIDYTNLNGSILPGGTNNLKSGFNLMELAAPLAQKPQNEWTYDEQSLVRYLTQRTAGFPSYELGYTAVSGAYSSNLSAFLGRDHNIPGAAFYALAAAHFKQYLDAGQYDNELGAALIAMELGELYRLLGRHTDATAAFAKARELNKLDPQTLKILAHLEQLNGAGDKALHRAPLEEVEAPPIGWVVDLTLPAINAELDAERERWAAVDDPQQITAQMLEGL